MTTRRQFAGGILAAGALANFALVAAPGNNGNGNPCNGHGKADQCHGNGANKDVPTPPTPVDPCKAGIRKDVPTPPNPCRSGARMGQDVTPPPACKSAGGKEDHVE